MNFFIIVCILFALSISATTNTTYLTDVHEHAKYSVNKLLSWYQFSEGVFMGHLSYPPDWCRGNSLTVLVDYLIYNNNYQTQQGFFSDSNFTVVSAQTEHLYIWSVIKDIQDKQGNDFYQTADYFDDIMWWCLAYTRAYNVALLYNDKDRANRFLSTAISIHDVVTKDSCGHSTTCGGGCYWSRAFSYKNAITNELYFSAATNLALLTGDETFLSRASESLQWILASGMISADSGLVVDGLDDDESCKPTGGVWTYNQGVILGGLGNMGLLSADKRFAKTAATPVNYTVLGESLISAANSQLTNADGVLTESGCGDGGLFKGVYTRYLRYFIDTTRTEKADEFVAFLNTQFNSLWAKSRDPAVGYFGKSWAEVTHTAAGEAPRDHNLQVSGIDLLNALTGLTGDGANVGGKKRNQDGKTAAGTDEQVCNGHGSLISGECYCRWRFSGADCSVETSWAIYYSGMHVTLSSTGGGMLCATAADKASVTTCLSDQLIASSTFLVRHFVTSSTNSVDDARVQLLTANGDYLGFALSQDSTASSAASSGVGVTGRVVVYSQESVTNGTVSVDYTLFEPVVQVEAQMEVYEFVAFKGAGASGSGGGGFVTVLKGGVVRLTGEVTDESLFVTNLNQVCE